MELLGVMRAMGQNPTEDELLNMILEVTQIVSSMSKGWGCAPACSLGDLSVLSRSRVPPRVPSRVLPRVLSGVLFSVFSSATLLCHSLVSLSSVTLNQHQPSSVKAITTLFCRKTLKYCSFVAKIYEPKKLAYLRYELTLHFIQLWRLHSLHCGPACVSSEFRFAWMIFCIVYIAS